MTPYLGVFYAIAKGIWAFDVGASFYLPIAVRAAPHSGDSIRSHVGIRASAHALARSPRRRHHSLRADRRALPLDKAIPIQEG